MEDVSNYNKLKESAEQYFHSVGKVYCPAFDEAVHFVAEGFNHLVFKSPRSERERPSQILRFKLLPLAKELVELTTTYQEYEETLQERVVKRHKHIEKRSLPVQYWGLIAILRGRKVKVIIRKIGNGQLHFWSVVPAWVTNKYRDLRFFSTMKGNPEED